MRLTRHGRPTGAPAEFVALTGDWPASPPDTFNANGIRTLSARTRSCSTTPGWAGSGRSTRRSGVTRRIPVTGGPPITSGDGLELVGRTLYNVRGSGPQDVSVVRLRRDGGEWRATWLATLTDASLDVPSTATAAVGSLWVVNARFGIASPETAPFWITRLPTV